MGDKTKEEKIDIKNNSIFMFKNWIKWDKKSLLYFFIRIPAMVILPMLTALIPTVMIECINRQVSMKTMIFTVAVLSILVAMMTWLAPFMQEKLNGSARITRMKYAIQAFEKTMKTDFVNVESLASREKLERAKQFYIGYYSGSADFYDCMCQSAVSIVGVAASIGLLYKLRPFMILVILLTCAGEFFLLRAINKADGKARNDRNSIFMKFDYFYRISHEFAAGKDIRIYGLADWFTKIAADGLKLYTQIIGKYTRQTLGVTAIRALLNLVRELIAYAYLIYCVLKNMITVPEFIFYFGIVTGFSGWVLGLVQQYSNLERCANECAKYRQYLDIPDQPTQDSCDALCREGRFSIEFKNVSFSYNQSECMTLKKMSFQVGPGENIAIVGENGAGKTTAIKLLCGLYKPVEGDVFINGINTREISSKAYFSCFSAVFQDYKFLPMSIAKNIALCSEEEIDREKLMYAMRESGILERINELENKENTNMVKEVYKDAADFSGGEKQKLLLARALYKDAPILILDEPTAALDPIAENELYLKYSELTKDKTSFFISHRLSSTRFCDRIFFITDGTIAEEGTHEELMALKGKYYRMFMLQSYYYREREEA